MHFENHIHLTGIVTEVSKEHLDATDLAVWRITMYTEHFYPVDGYTERSHFVVLVFPDVVCYDHCGEAIQHDSLVNVRGRLRTVIKNGMPCSEIIASELVAAPNYSKSE